MEIPKNYTPSMVEMPELARLDELRKASGIKKGNGTNIDMSELLVWVWYILSGVLFGIVMQSSRMMYL